MQQTGGITSTASLVPWADRVRLIAWFRVSVTVIACIFAATDALAWTGHPVPLLATLGGYAIGSLGLVVRLHTDPGRRRLFVFNATLILDGVLLAWLLHATGWTVSPLRPVVLLHVLVVTLGASYRTGFKQVLWHSLVLTICNEAMQVEVLPRPGAVVLPTRDLWWFIGAIAATAAVTTGAAQVNERLLRRNRFDLDRLADMEEAFQYTTGPAQVAETAMQVIASTFRTTRLVLLTVTDGMAAVTSSTSGDDALPVNDGKAPLTDSPALSAAQTSRQNQLLASTGDVASEWLETILPDARNVVVAPLIVGDELVGALVAELRGPKGRRIARQTLFMLMRFARHTATAMATALLSEQLRDQAERDGLTGLLNRRGFDAAIERELTRTERSGQSLSLLLLDIDHFKGLNDTHGHLVGDEVLRSLGATLTDARRAGDVAARYGGEEFVVVMPDTDAAAARAAADRLRTEIADRSDPVPFTISGGLATVDGHQTDPSTLIAAADEALYAAKQSGRDRIVATSEPLARSHARSSDPTQ